MSTKRKLSDGTQVIPMMEITEARCKCGLSLTWHAIHAEQRGNAYTSEAECKCGMAYLAGQATIKVEGINTHEY